jgi:ferredoxin
MEIHSIKLVYFSPTRTTRQVLNEISHGLNASEVDPIDLTMPESATKEWAPITDDLIIMGVPVYGGRVPLDAKNRLKRLQTNGIPAVLVVVYGNRAYEDALLELKDLAIDMGCKPVAGGAFIGEHSLATRNLPIANGRPDRDDGQKAREFGQMIQKKLKAIKTPEEMAPLHVPGHFPYIEQKKRSVEAPVTRTSLCQICGECAVVCPTGAVHVWENVMTDPDLCIHCCACIKICPVNARVVEGEGALQVAQWLSKNLQDRKEPETYL